jgi:hypothetical protein
MGLTQKYKQQQQQVRVHTNESNYLKGMYFSDVPLVEGYSRVLMNFDIDSLSGKLTPRKGLQTLGISVPTAKATKYLHTTSGYNTLVASKICAASDSVDPRKINRVLQSVLYNTDTRSLAILTCPTDINEAALNTFDVIPFTANSNDVFVTPEPYVIGKPSIHKQDCMHNHFFKKPVGTFAFSNNYYTFLKRNKYTTSKIADLPSPSYLNKEGNPISSFRDLKDNSIYATAGDPADTGKYFKFVSGESIGLLAYYDTAGNITSWDRSEEALQLEVFPYIPADGEAIEYILCYTKLGADIQDDEVLLDESISRTDLAKDVYYTCKIVPQRLNPTEASSWGYNMLLQDPYAFKCETTAANNITILGMLPYDKDGKEPVLTPRRNQEITLKGYYRAPSKYHTAKEQAQYYATTKQGEVETAAELPTPATEYKYGDWWYVKSTKTYYMCMPKFENDKATTATKVIDVFGETKPAATEKLSQLSSDAEDLIRVRWQIRHSGASDWIDIYNETFTLSAYRDHHGEGVPFTVTTQLPAEEVLVKLTISDPQDIEANEEYVLSTNTIGLSVTSDELANTLNLTAKSFNLGQATGMCEWEQRLVLWGVPNALNTIFISDVNNPTFFPYPNNIDVFTDPIISVHNYGNELLVLTTSALYRLTWDSEGLGWTHTLVQQNLHVTEEDTYMSCVIKNMFFFKSGEYYYMMVPKASANTVRGEVAIAPISKPIERLLDNFHEEVYNLIKVIVDQPDLVQLTNSLVNYFSYVDNTKVVVNYVYDLNKTLGDKESITDSKYLYVQLLYDTDARTWSMRAFEAAHMLHPSHADALQQDRFLDITPDEGSNKLVLQYYKFRENTDRTLQYIDNKGVEHLTNRVLKNYQYLDTGNREINTEMKKRFREFQFKLKNNNAINLGFLTSFLVDGSLRKDLQKYSPRLITDENSNEGVIVVERTLDPASMSYNTTRIERILVPKRMLQDDGELLHTTLGHETDPDCWVLDQSALPGRTFWKIRVPISGKGFTPRVIFLSTNEAEYELLGHSWVYRTMHAR